MQFMLTPRLHFDWCIADTLLLDDGTEVTTYESPDGVVMYMNWDTGTWQAIPQDMLQAAQAEEAAIVAEEEQKLAIWEAQNNVHRGGASGGGTNGDAGGGGGSAVDDGGGGGGGEWGYNDDEEGEDDEVDLRAGEYNHPVHGVLSTYLFENNRNSRLYFAESTGSVDGIIETPLATENLLEDTDGVLCPPP